jgi:hypothetical protein
MPTWSVPPNTACAQALRGWFEPREATSTDHIEQGSPWEYGFTELFRDWLCLMGAPTQMGYILYIQVNQCLSMAQPIKKYPLAASWFNETLIDWALQGCPLPAPHYIKVLHLDQLILASKVNVFIETGTLMGDTSGLISLAHPELEVHTIEISDHYYEEASKRLAVIPNITVHHGDSGRVLPLILRNLSTPALFWLDAHFSGGNTGRGASDCPISEELEAIISHPQIANHVLAFDDIRDFNGQSGYPNLPAFKEYLSDKLPTLAQYERHDSLILAPPAVIEAMKNSAPKVSELQVIC